MRSVFEKRKRRVDGVVGAFVSLSLCIELPAFLSWRNAALTASTASLPFACLLAPLCPSRHSRNTPHRAPCALGSRHLKQAAFLCPFAPDGTLMRPGGCTPMTGEGAGGR